MMTPEAGVLLQVYWNHRIVLVGQSVEPPKQSLANLRIIVVARMFLMPEIIFFNYTLFKEMLRGYGDSSL